MAGQDHRARLFLPATRRSRRDTHESNLADIADPDVLRRAARAAAVSEAAVGRALGDRSLLDQAAHEHEEAVEHGITGIPALLVPGQPPLVGAVPAETYRAALERVLAWR